MAMGYAATPFEREAGLEQRAVEVVHAAARRVAVQLAHAQQQLAREAGVGELHGGKVHISASQSRTVTPAPCQGARVRTR